MSAGANVKVSANSSTYQQALKAARDSTKELASQFSLASTQAKLFGSTTDQLKAKQQELTAKIKAQKEITSLHHTEVERLTKVLSNQKSRQQELERLCDRLRLQSPSCKPQRPPMRQRKRPRARTAAAPRSWQNR